MKRTRRYFAAMMLVLVMTTALSVTTQASTKSKAYKAYKSWIKKGCLDEYGNKREFNKFCLVRIDSDSVPELVGQKLDYGDSSMSIVSYKNGKLSVQSIRSGVALVGGFRGNAYYIPRKGKIYTTSWMSGTGYANDNIYVLNKKGFKEKAKGTRTKELVWNGKTIASRKTYDAKLAKAFNVKKAKDFDALKFRSKKNILKKLK